MKDFSISCIHCERCKGTHFIHYITYVVQNNETIFLSKLGNHTKLYMWEPIPLSTICTIASIHLNSPSLTHLLFYVRWGCRTHVRKYSMHILPWASLQHYSLIQTRFNPLHTHCRPNLLPTLILLTITMFISKFLEHRESLNSIDTMQNNSLLVSLVIFDLGKQY